MSKAVTSNDWEGESDARSLIAHHEIMNDPKRKKKAEKHLDRLHTEAKKQLAATKAAKGLKKAFPGG